MIKNNNSDNNNNNNNNNMACGWYSATFRRNVMFPFSGQKVSSEQKSDVDIADSAP